MNKHQQLNKDLDEYLGARKKSRLKLWFSRFDLHKKPKEEDVSPEIISRMLESKDISRAAHANNAKKTYPAPSKMENKKDKGKDYAEIKKSIQKLTKEKQSMEERNRDAVEIWEITKKLLDYLPQDKQSEFTMQDDYKNCKNKVEPLG